MPLRIQVNYQGADNVCELPLERVVIGRPGGESPPDLDLSPDPSVSRQHAVLEVKSGSCWLRDLDSRYGTFLNDRDLRGAGECLVRPEDTIRIGNTKLRAQLCAEEEDAPAAAAELPSLTVVRAMETTRNYFTTAQATPTSTEQQMAFLLALPLEFAARKDSDSLLSEIVGHLVKAIPKAQRGALLLRDRRQDRLLLNSFVSQAEPAVSETLARRAMNERRGFIWHSGNVEDLSQSIRELAIVNGMYAPLVWQEKVFGVICVDTPVAGDSFSEGDLAFLLAIAQQTAMSLARQELELELYRQNRVAQRLLANFSPKIAAVLLEQARSGKLRPGGTKSEVTVLYCDICGFTRKAGEMDPQDIVEMLNEYLGAIVQVIFRHDGTVDKFIGDAVLTVFGSPEADPAQNEKAIRAAVAIQEVVAEVSRLREVRGDPVCQVRVGVHCGEVFHGFIGALDRLEFTVIGDPINRTCRYCDAAEPGGILVSAKLFQHIYKLVKAEKISVETKEGDLPAYRIKSLTAAG